MISASGAAFSTLSCSMADASTRFRPLPSIAMLLSSVPPEANTTSAGKAPTSAATWRRAPSIRLRAVRPARCTDEGLPPTRSAAAMASNAAGRSGLVAL
jgi:hypothetical protein